MKCKHCGAEIKDGSIYCSSCGKEIQLVPEYNISEDDLFREIIEDKNEKLKAEEEEKQKLLKEEEEKRKKKKTLTIIIGVLVALIILFAVIIGAVTAGNHNKSFDYQYDKALEQYSDENYDKALEYLNNALSIDGSSIDARILMAECYIGLEDYDSAEEILLEVTELEADNKDAYILLIDIYTEQDDYDSLLSLAKSSDDEDIIELFNDVLVGSPIISVRGGEYTETLTVELSGDDGCSIYYTTDGTEPTEDSALYSEAVEIGDGETVLNAICVDSEGHMSLCSTETYNITLTAPEAPSVSLSSGTYTTQMEITVTVPEGATAYYTWDGSTPTASSIEYTGPVQILEGNNIFSVVICDKNGLYSPVTSRTYVYIPEEEETTDTEVEVDPVIADNIETLE
ncbi:MAG: chitobiase/beta-hexosaminidase C-terminal domain-containing protein [Eubacterium sp.]|nr:chitobiase/beta-hexosaminidase C-terminal domain-containing protein [Eubacterium sp.]